MALGISFRASVHTTTGAASYATTTTYTPAANSLLVAFVVGTGSNDDPNHATTPFTGHGVSWTKKTISNNALSTTHALSCWVADAGVSPTSAACTAQWTTNRTGAVIIEYEITGANLSGGASAALIQAVTNSGTGTSGSIGLSAESDFANRPLAFFVHLANQGSTPRASWTEDAGADGNFNNPATGAAAQYRADAFETTASASWNTSSAWRGIALEIKALAGVILLPMVAALALTGALVGVKFGALVTGQLALVGQAPTLFTGDHVRAIPTASLTFTGGTPSLSLSGGVTSVPAGSLTLSGQLTGLGYSALSTGSLTVTGQAPAALINTISRSPLTGPLILTGQPAAKVFQGPSVGAMAISGRVPMVSVGISGAATIIALPAGSLAVSGTYIEILFKGPDVGSLAFTGQAPTFTAEVKPVPAGALVLTGRAPSLHTVVGLPTAALVATGQPAALLQPGPGVIGPGTAALVLTGRAPSVAVQGSFIIAVPAGGLTFTGPLPTAGVSATSLALFINGSNETLRLRINTLNYTDDLNSRNTLTCELNDLEGTYHPQCGQEVVLYAMDGVTRLFAGTIEEPEEIAVMRKPTDTPVNIIRLTVVDFNQIADRHLAAESYDDASFTTIVTDLITDYLADDDVVIGTIDAGPTFVRKVFNYRSVADCFNELSEDTGYSWWIDYDKVFHFRARDAVSAPISVSLTNSTIRRVSKRTSRNDYRNRQYIRAGRDLTDPLTETFVGDNVRQTFTVGFPIGEVPTVLLNGGPQTVGIRGVSDDLLFDWFWNKDSNEISQRASSVPPTTADSLVVIYRGLFPVLVQQQDDSKILERQAVEGGSGVYESIEDYTDIDSADLAFATAVAKLQRYGLIKTTITFETDRDGLSAGQLIPVEMPQHGIDDDYLIQSVQAQDINGKFLRYTVRVIDGDAVGGWLAFYQRLMTRRRELVQRENELLLLGRNDTEAVIAGDSLLVDTPVARETRIGLAQIGRSEVGVT